MIKDKLRKLGWKLTEIYQTFSVSHGLNIDKWIKSSKDANEFSRILTQVYVGEINSLEEVILEIAVKNLGSDCTEEKREFLAKTIWKTGIRARAAHAAYFRDNYVSTLDFNSLYPSTQAKLLVQQVQRIYPTLVNSADVTAVKPKKPVSFNEKWLIEKLGLK